MQNIFSVKQKQFELGRKKAIFHSLKKIERGGRIVENATRLNWNWSTASREVGVILLLNHSSAKSVKTILINSH